jgi:phage baseplate assembly protein W
MAQISPIPGTGIDRRTGKILSGWAHVLQCLEVIFTTFFGERVLRRYIGSDVPPLLGRNMTNPTILRFWSAICVAINRPASMGGEPRFRITKIQAFGSAPGMSSGSIGFALAGLYFPRGHLGDYSIAIPMTVNVGSTANAIGSGAPPLVSDGFVPAVL